MSNATLDLIHTKIHAIRMMPNYRPSQFERDLNKIICEQYKKSCKECARKLIVIEEQEKEPKKKGFSMGDILQGFGA